MAIKTITALALGFLLSFSISVEGAKGGRRSTAVILTLTNDADCIAEDQTTGGPADLNLNGDCVAGGVAIITATPLTLVAQQISIEGVGNNDGITFTISGADADGKSRYTSEALTGSNAGTATSVQYYTTITNIAASGAVTGDVEVGWLSANGGVTETLVPDLQGYGAEMSITVDVTGTVPYSIEHTAQNMPSKIEPLWFNTVDLTTKTADAEGNILVAVGGVRAKCTTATCVVNLMIFQAKLGRR